MGLASLVKKAKFTLESFKACRATALCLELLVPATQFLLQFRKFRVGSRGLAYKQRQSSQPVMHETTQSF